MNKQNIVIFNTLVLYGRLIFSAVVILLSTRIVLHELGTSDYGLYNLLVGMISMLSFLNAAMSSSTQRFLSYHLGKKENINNVFYYSVILHYVIAIVVVVIIEIIAQCFLISTLNIPSNRITISYLIVHFLSFSTFFTIISVPYDAVFNAHENMLVVSIIGCIESVLKLSVAYIITSNNFFYDKLVVYSVLMCLIPLISFLLKLVYCKKVYMETHFQVRKVKNLSLFRSMFSFAGWNLIGAISSITRNQGYAILFNLFGNVSVNAAYGIANQVNSQITFFSDTIVKALRPQIMISEGEGDRERMLRLSNFTSKIPFLLLLMVASPIIVDTYFVMSIWLKEIPTYTLEMVKIILIITLLVLMTKGTQATVEAVGNIKCFQIIVGGLHFISIPLGFILLYAGYPPSYALYGILIEEIIATISRIWIAGKVANFSSLWYVHNVLIRNLCGGIIILATAYLLCLYLNEGFLRFSILTIWSCIATVLFGYKICLTDNEQKTAKNIGKNIYYKIKSKK